MSAASVSVPSMGRMDLQIARAISEAEPDWILHVGERNSILPFYSAYLLDQTRKSSSRIISVVGNPPDSHPEENIEYLEGDLLDPTILERIKKLILPWHRAMVVLEDTSYCRDRLAYIQAYAPSVTEGCHLILGKKIEAFAERCVEFEPDWLRVQAGMYLRVNQADR